MALIFNNYVKEVMATTWTSTAADTSVFNILNYITYLYLYPSTISFPSAAPASNSLPAGSICTIVLANGVAVSPFTRTSNLVSLLNPAAGTTSAGGTLSWWYIRTGQATSTAGTIISDSIGLPGSGAVLTVSNLTPASSGVSITCSAFNLRIG